MSGATDSGMVKTMGLIMAAVTGLALICAIAARALGIGGDVSEDPLLRNALIQRIQPVASVRTSADDLPAASQGAMEVAGGSARTGEELVADACAACHAAGVAQAPKLDDTAEWAKRREAGLDALVASVINGKGAMGPRGGSNYTDDEITLAVQHIAGFEVEDAAAAPAAQSTDSAEAPAAESTETEQTTAAESESESTESADAPAAEADESTETSEAPANEEAATENASVAPAALVVGQVPEGLTDNVKANVDGICAACHLAGVSGAPKIGDKDAWQARADKGLDALVATVTNGLNAMPPRGGSALTDEEIPMAIQYLMSK